MDDSHTKLTDDYFDYIAQCFPVMCASDEFDFLPRAQKATQYYDQVDSLDRDAIEQCLSFLREFQNRCDVAASNENELERLTDLALLKANASGVLIEFETKKSWRHNPLLYLKIAFIGLDHALTKPASGPEERTERTSARLRAIPGLLQQAIDNIDTVPMAYHRAALDMIGDCKVYLREISKDFINISIRDVNEELQKPLKALEAVEQSLRTRPPIPDQTFVLSALETTLKDHFSSTRSLSEIFEIAQEEWGHSLEQLKKLQADVDPDKSWQALYHAYSPSDIDEKDTISLYQHEIERLGRFFRDHGFRDFDLNSSLELCETPTYLRSVRSSASFSSALTADPMERDVFYITTQFTEQRGEEAGSLSREEKRPQTL